MEFQTSSCNFTLVCRFCLSTDRTLSDVEGVSYAFGALTDWEPHKNARVCWECHAQLARFGRFRQQAAWAKRALEDVNVAPDFLDLKCLSTLGFNSKYFYDKLYTHEDKDLVTESDTNFVATQDVFAEFEEDNQNEIEDTQSDNQTFDVNVIDSVNNEDIVINDEDLINNDEIYSELKHDDYIVKNENDEEDDEKNDEMDVKLIDLKKEIEDLDDTGVMNKIDAWVEEIFQTDSEEEIEPIEEENLAEAIETLKIVFNKKSNLDSKKFDKKSKRKAIRKYEIDGATDSDALYKEEVLDFMDDPNDVEIYEASEQELIDFRREFLEKYDNRVKCDSCLIVFKKEENLRRHNEGCHKKMAGPHQCEVCQCRFLSSEETSCHAARHRYLLLCRQPDCGYLHHRKEMMRRHARRHRKKDQSRDGGNRSKPTEKELMCEQCGYKCMYMSCLRAHMNTHLEPDDRPYQCDVCKKRFSNKFRMTAHIRIHTGESFPCHLCKRFFRDNGALNAHIKTKHLNANVAQQARPANGTNRHFRPRRECHKEPLKCEQCDKTFKYNSTLKMHRIYHQIERPYECKICNKKYKTRFVLSKHMGTHSDERPFKCDQCTLAFKYYAGLWTHKLSHKGEKPHQCSVCGNSFVLKGQLREHMVVHTKERPYGCDTCGKKFIRKDKLKKHLTTHGSEQWTSQFQV